MAPSLPEILRRFRPVAAPGPAGPAGVPVDRRTELEDELALVFAELGPTIDEVRSIAARAGEEADRRRSEAAREAQEILADARSRADSERATAAAAHLTALDDERRRLEADAHAEAERIRARAHERLAPVTDVIVAAVRGITGLDAEAARADRRSEEAG